MRQLKMKICSFLSWILLAGIVCVGNANALLPGDDGDPGGGGSGGGEIVPKSVGGIAEGV